MAAIDCRGLFVTGTDTGVGKTAVTSVLIRLLRGAGIRTGGYKPVASGAEPSPGGLVWSDAQALWSALDGEFPLERVCPQRFVAPLAPPVAAEVENRRVDRALIQTGYEWWRHAVDLLLVEGAGGLLSPVTDTQTNADLARDLRFPLLIIARLGLGTINHTLLTVEAARRRQLPIAGIVLNNPLPPDPHDPSLASNPAQLAKWCDVPILAVVPHQPRGDLLAVPELQRIQWSSLARTAGAQPDSE